MNYHQLPELISLAISKAELADDIKQKDSKVKGHISSTFFSRTSQSEMHIAARHPPPIIPTHFSLEIQQGWNYMFALELAAL